ncbi:hypothetical protein M409DRAFT_66081 [Zasmidium cellare ATCC 36951]|uniref:Tyrosinase copper-binding domain-containing protein n=1 Tax=Zasmidium cellare ATCC 36951 TaxID=1080233 RepID=A0A6A6CMY4_ZASCE|nr:uncharacterized protein M409DRAFT_66081 [Zasmidium cellare ATCC 36951]KAF2167578.1 hypothetical protein M409DRAFT_66081 [Zasmidium cellare ATCC 36951]
MAFSVVPGLGQRYCESPAVRREWRDLLSQEKAAYVDAVKCLTEEPSILTGNGSLFDDFSYVHMNIGIRTHWSAAFFPWHRLLLHVFETLLRTHCGYREPLPYWDWTLDWLDVAASPVFDPSLGFGGGGDPNVPSAVGNDSFCLQDGPFETFTVSYAEGPLHSPHCLSRFDFSKTGTTGVNPAMIRSVLEFPSYDGFRNATETVHNLIHRAVGGDFATWASPNDPIFYLHHAQLDRMWWQWQYYSPQRRQEYCGSLSPETLQRASIKDLLSVGKLGKAMPVEEVMDTQGNLLCYTYQTERDDTV